MVAAPRVLPDLNQLDPVSLKALIFLQHEQLLSKDAQLIARDNEIEQLKLLILKLRRLQFGRKSEKLDRQIEQLELRLEDLESAQTASALPQTRAQSGTAAGPKRRPARGPLPDHLRREIETHAPAQTACPECGG